MRPDECQSRSKVLCQRARAGHSALYVHMIGSRADRVVHLAPCPVLVIR
jgi:nucleotide-binding universal stress UspA family protein